jgi:hypothetical protein
MGNQVVEQHPPEGTPVWDRIPKSNALVTVRCAGGPSRKPCRGRLDRLEAEPIPCSCGCGLSFVVVTSVAETRRWGSRFADDDGSYNARISGRFVYPKPKPIRVGAPGYDDEGHEWGATRPGPAPWGLTYTYEWPCTKCHSTRTRNHARLAAMWTTAVRNGLREISV